MKTIPFLAYALTLLLTLSCKNQDPDPGSYPCQTGNCNTTMPLFFYVIADNKGQSLTTAGTDGVSVSYLENGQLTNSPTVSYPVASSTGAAIAYVMNGSYMADKSEAANIKTFYLFFRGKTDTLGLDIRRDPTNTSTGGHTVPIVSFNGKSMQQVVSNPTYYVLKRR